MFDLVVLLTPFWAFFVSWFLFVSGLAHGIFSGLRFDSTRHRYIHREIFYAEHRPEYDNVPHGRRWGIDRAAGSFWE